MAVGDQQLKASTPIDFKVDLDEEVSVTIKPEASDCCRMATTPQVNLLSRPGVDLGS